MNTYTMPSSAVTFLIALLVCTCASCGTNSIKAIEGFLGTWNSSADPYMGDHTTIESGSTDNTIVINSPGSNYHQKQFTITDGIARGEEDRDDIFFNNELILYTIEWREFRLSEDKQTILVDDVLEHYLPDDSKESEERDGHIWTKL